MCKCNRGNEEKTYLQSFIIKLLKINAFVILSKLRSDYWASKAIISASFEVLYVCLQPFTLEELFYLAEIWFKCSS